MAIFGLFLYASLCACNASGTTHPAHTATAGQSIDIPIHQRVLPDGTIRYWIDIRIDGHEIPAMLDSGSVGLRLMPYEVASLHLKPGRFRARYLFGGAVVLAGTLVRVDAAIGTSAPMPLLVQAAVSVSCTSAHPNCPASDVPNYGYRIGADGYMAHGFIAILGIGLQPAGIPNPLGTFGGNRWIIDLPLPASRKPGRLILDPGPKQLRGYKLFPLKPLMEKTPTGISSGWQPALPGCLLKQRPRRSVCHPILLDTGTVGIRIMDNLHGHDVRWDSGSRLALGFRPPGSDAMGFNFMEGQSRATRVLVMSGHIRGRRYAPRINAGVVPYYFYSVAYDARHGTIGLKVRESARR